MRQIRTGQFILPQSPVRATLARPAEITRYDLHPSLQGQADAVMQAMTQNAAGQCAAIQVDCANRIFAPFLSPSADCTECVFDWNKNSPAFMVAAVGAWGSGFAESAEEMNRT
jgi:hypothetical protein